MASPENSIITYINSLNIPQEQKAKLIASQPKTLADVSFWLVNNQDMTTESSSPNPFAANSDNTSVPAAKTNTPNAPIFPAKQSSATVASPASFWDSNKLVDTDDASWGLGISRTNPEFNPEPKPEPEKRPFVLSQSSSSTSADEAKICQNTAINLIIENISEANEIFSSQHLGAIKTYYDENLRSDDDKLKTSNVKKVLDYQDAGTQELIKARDGNLTKRQYYLDCKQRLKDMIYMRANVLKTQSGMGIFDDHKKKYSQKEIDNFIDQYIDDVLANTDIEKIHGTMTKLASLDGPQEAKMLKTMVDTAVEKAENPSKHSELPEKDLRPFWKKSVPAQWDSSEKISFEEVYKLERGTEYSERNVKEYILAQKSMDCVSNAFNKKQQFVNFANELSDDKNLSPQEKSEKILEGYAQYYALSLDNGKSQLQKVIDDSKSQIVLNDEGIDLSAYPTEAEKQKALNKLLQFAAEAKENDFQQFLGGKTIEDYQRAYESASSRLIGEDNAQMLAEAMKNDNVNAIQKYSGYASYGSMGIMTVGGVLCFTPLAPLGASMVTYGGAGAIGTIAVKNSAEIVDLITNDKVDTSDLNRVTNDLIFDAGGFIVGMGAGKAGMKAFSKIIDEKLAATFTKEINEGNRSAALKAVFSDPQKLASFMKAGSAKIGTDFLISYTGDLMMMGVLDTEQDWQSLLEANLTGILVGTSGDVKEVAGVRTSSRPKSPHTSQNKPLTQWVYALSLEGKDVKVKDDTGKEITGTVTGVKLEQGKAQVEVNGKYYSTDNVAAQQTRRVEQLKQEGNAEVHDKPDTTAEIAAKADKANGSTPKKDLKSLTSEELFDAVVDELQTKNNALEIHDYINTIKNNPAFEFRNSFSTIEIYTRNRTQLKINYDDNINIVSYSIGNVANGKYFIYDENTKAFKETKFDSYVQHTDNFVKYRGVESKYLLENEKLPLEVKQTLLKRSDMPITEDGLNALGSVIKTKEDAETAIALLLATGSDSAIKRSISKHVFRDTPKIHYNRLEEIVEIMKNDKVKTYVQDRLKTGSRIEKGKIEEIMAEGVTPKANSFVQERHDIIDMDVELKAGQSIHDLYRQNPDYFNTKIPAGEVAEINGKLYCNSGHELVEIKVSRQKFEKLFPPDSNFGVTQHSLGDCYFVAPLGAIMSDVGARAEVFRMFEQKGEDIYIKSPDFKTEAKFSDGKINKLAPISVYNGSKGLTFALGDKHLSGPIGLQMIEQAYAVLRNSDSTAEGVIDVNKIFFMNKQMDNLEGGIDNEAYSFIFGSDNYQMKYYLNNSNNIVLGKDCNFNSLEEALNAANGNIATCRTRSKNAHGVDILENHAYRIVGYDPETKMVTVANPHYNSNPNAKEIDEIKQYPLSVFEQYFVDIKVVTLQKKRLKPS